MRSGDGRSSKTPCETSWHDPLRPAILNRAASHSAVASNRGAPNAKGSKLGQRKVTRLGLGSNSIKERTIGNKKKASKGVTTGQRSKSGSSALGHRADSKRVPVATSTRERRERGSQDHNGPISSSSHQVLADSGFATRQQLDSVSLLANRQQPAAVGNARARAFELMSAQGAAAGSAHEGSTPRDNQPVPTDANQLLSTPARCKVARVVVPETPETKTGRASAPDTSCTKKPPRMPALPLVDKFKDDITSQASTLHPCVADADMGTQESAEASMQTNAKGASLLPPAAFDSGGARVPTKRGGAGGAVRTELSHEDDGGNQAMRGQKAAHSENAALGREKKYDGIATSASAPPLDVSILVASCVSEASNVSKCRKELQRPTHAQGHRELTGPCAPTCMHYIYLSVCLSVYLSICLSLSLSLSLSFYLSISHTLSLARALSLSL